MSTISEGVPAIGYSTAGKTRDLDQRYDKSSQRATLGLSLSAGLLCCFAAFAGRAYAITNFNQTDVQWKVCTGVLVNGSRCAGGSADPTSWSQTFEIATPSLDGESMELSLSGPVYANNGWYYDTGANDSATHFTLDMWFNAPSNADIGALEFDQYQYLLKGHGGVTSNTRLYFGTQCVTGGNWWIWDSNGVGWVDTKAACRYTVSSTTFNHLVISVHRVSGDTSCSGRPCMYYDSISVGGTTYVSNKKTSSGALPSGWGEQTGLMLQLDTGGSCGSACTIKEYVDEGNFTIQ
jgi:hypothetical protein